MRHKVLTAAVIASTQFLSSNLALAEGSAVWTTEERSTDVAGSRLRTCEGDMTTADWALEWTQETESFRSVSYEQFRVTVQGYDMISFTTDRMLHSSDGETLEVKYLVIGRAAITDAQGAFTSLPLNKLSSPPDTFRNPEQTTLYREDLSFFDGGESSATIDLFFRIQPVINSPEHLSEVLEKDWTFTVNFNCFDGDDADA